MGGGNCGCGYAAAIILRCVDGKTTPARADFNYIIFRRQIQLLADASVFRQGRFFEGAVLTLEYAAGVGKGLVEEELVEVVP